MQDYDKNNKPLVSVASTKAPFKMKSENLAPLTKVASPKAPFGEEVMSRNSVTSSSSAKLQKASRLGGRVDLSNGKPPFSK